MKIVCAWCHKVLKEYESTKEMVSHGICPECLREITEVGTEMNLRDFLDRLGFPVLVIDGAVAVQRVNRTAEQALGRPAPQLENIAAGLAIECQNAHTPEGCGRAEHCAGCILRQTIVGTRVDGRPRYGMYSQHQILTPLGAKPIRFRFSTTRMGEAVMLAIDEFEDLQAAS